MLLVSCRFTRNSAYHQALPTDGGPTYSTQTLMDNWVEDRRDGDYTPGE
jgi:hypothetical protein